MRYIRFAIAAVCISTLAPPAVSQSSRAVRDEPRPMIFRSASGEWQLDLPPAMEDALDRVDRDFEAWTASDYAYLPESYEPTPRQLPWAVVGDFNGDGRLDLAIAGRDDRDALVIVVLSSGRSRYHAVEAEREPYDPDEPRTIRLPVLSYLYPGRYVIDDPRLRYPRELAVDVPAVQVTGGRRNGAVLYTVESDALVPYYLSDRPLVSPRPQGPRPRY